MHHIREWERAHPTRVRLAVTVIAAVLVVALVLLGISVANPLRGTSGDRPASSSQPSAAERSQEAPVTSPSLTPSPGAVPPAPAAPGTPGPSPEPLQTATPGATVTAGVVQAVVAGVRVRDAAHTGAASLASLSLGQQARTAGQLVQADGFTWTDIELEPSGMRGWAAIAALDGSPWLASILDGPIVATSESSVALVDPLSGSRQRILDGVNVTDLAAAPDGERVAVVVDQQWVEVVGSSLLTNLEGPPAAEPADLPSRVRGPAFAPDGSAIAYLAGDDDGAFVPRLMGSGSESIPALPSVSTLMPLAWSIDSSFLLTSIDYDSRDGDDNWEVVALDLGHLAPRRLTDWPQFDGSVLSAPDGSAIAYLSDAESGMGRLALADLDGQAQRIVHEFESQGPYSIGSLTWEPAGDRVAVVFGYDDRLSEVHVIDVAAAVHASFLAPGHDCRDLTWSPTGTRLALLCRHEPASELRLFVMGTDGTDAIDFGPASAIDWARELGR